MTNYKVQIEVRNDLNNPKDWGYADTANSDKEADQAIKEMAEEDEGLGMVREYRKVYICAGCEKEWDYIDEAENCCLDKRLYALYKEGDL